MRYTIIFLIVAIAGYATQARAQHVERHKVMAALASVAKAYNDAGVLSFDVQYYYAAEQSPQTHLDSLKGRFKLYKNLYWYELDNTEVMSDSVYTVMLFKEDSLMHLSKRSATMPSFNPLAQLDSFLLNNKNISFEISTTKREEQIVINFNGSGLYKKIVYTIDPATLFLSKVTNVVKAETLYDASVKELLDEEEVYAIVEMTFGNYQKIKADKRVFDTKRYVKKTADGYEAQFPYNQYKIYFGSTNL